MIQCWTRVSPYIMERILKDGRFKTRFEGVGSAASLNDLDQRAEVEQKFYGYALDMPVEQRPIFGYLCGQANGEATHGHLILEEYGNAAIRFKDEIKSRTTFCLGDSLFSDETPRPFCEENLPENLDALLPYVEAQFHGGVTVADMAEVVFLVTCVTNPIREAMTLLREHGIESRVEVVE